MNQTEQREKWLRYICDLKSPGRYLLPGGHLALETHSGSAAVDLEAFFKRLSDRKASKALLGAAYFLSHPAVGQFMRTDLPRLLRGLSHNSVAAPRSAQREIKGRVDWEATLRGRFSGKVPRGSHVTARNEKTADVPENQLLKLFLSSIAQRAREIERLLGTGQLHREFKELWEEAERALRSPYLVEVADVTSATPQMHARARRHREKLYTDVARLQQELAAAVQEGEWTALANLLNKGWLAPIDTDKLFELYALVMTLDVLENEVGLGEPESYALIQKKRREVALFKGSSPPLTVRVYFNQTPKTLFQVESEYVSFFDQYEGIGRGSERRPDIFIQFSHEAEDDFERRVLVEVKKSADSLYQRDSLYKVMGYLRDFKAVWEKAVQQSPKAILFFPEDVRPRDGKLPEGELALLSANDRTRLARLLLDAIRPYGPPSTVAPALPSL